MERSDSFLRQLSSKEGWKSASKRWGGGGGGGGGWKQVEGMYGEMMMKKRVMVVVDQSSHSKHAMMWALTHVTNKADILTLLHIVSSSSHSASSSHLASSLASLCNACKPQVEVEALAIQGPKMETVMSQVKKLEVSVLVLGQKHPSPFLNWLQDEFVEKKCINHLE
ncbi:uncharacterized protein LOC131003854 [Salvia miltiorrhiza]|uniref:uncharacterized protein LOC131003854 n=1 Tax=Salvia miltiorrhiza TaxID=226208 RepID=UPI0025AC04A1|nr:uncharacterized protein LOC131003854 [Salvia miltiorrhiza]